MREFFSFVVKNSGRGQPHFPENAGLTRGSWPARNYASFWSADDLDRSSFFIASILTIPLLAPHALGDNLAPCPFA